MKYIEEEILKKREEKKKKEFNTLEKGIYINKKLITFSKKQPIPEIVLDLPDSFQIMPLELAEIKYPSIFRPQQIFTSIDLDINMGFNIFPQKLEEDDTWILAEHMKDIITKENNGIRYYYTKKIEKIQGCWFDFRSHAMDSDLYNMMLLMPMQTSFLHATFHCPYENGSEWRDAVVLMWKSIEKMEEEIDENNTNCHRTI